MRIEQEQRDLAGIEARCFCNSRKWWRLIGRGLTLCRRDYVASRAPSLREPLAIVWVGGVCRRNRQDHCDDQTMTDVMGSKHLKPSPDITAEKNSEDRN